MWIALHYCTVEAERKKRRLCSFLATITHCTLYTALHCTALHCIALHCSVYNARPIHCTLLNCTVLYFPLFYCSALFFPWLQCTVQILQATITGKDNYSNTLWRSSNNLTMFAALYYTELWILHTVPYILHTALYTYCAQHYTHCTLHYTYCTLHYNILHTAYFTLNYWTTRWILHTAQNILNDILVVRNYYKVHYSY